MRWKYFSASDRRTADALERRRRALLVPLHPDRVGSSHACEEMLTEYALALPHLKGGSANATAAAEAGSFFAPLPALLRSAGVDPAQLKAAVVEKVREAVGHTLEGALKKMFNL